RPAAWSSPSRPRSAPTESIPVSAIPQATPSASPRSATWPRSDNPRPTRRAVVLPEGRAALLRARRDAVARPRARLVHGAEAEVELRPRAAGGALTGLAQLDRALRQADLEHVRARREALEHDRALAKPEGPASELALARHHRHVPAARAPQRGRQVQ